MACWSELLTTNHEVPGSIPGSNMCFFSLKGEDAHGLFHVALVVTKISKSLSHQDIFLILETAKNRRGLSQVNKVDDPLL